jgi:PilZ domain
MKASPWRRKSDASSRPTVARRTPVADARVRVFVDAESHTPTHLLAAGPQVRAVPANEGTAFDVYEAIVHTQPAAQLKGTYTIEWDDRGTTVRADAVLEARLQPSGQTLLVIRLTSEAVGVQRRRYVRVSVRCQIELFRPGTTQAFSEGWTTDLSEGGMRCQINGSMPGVGVPVIVQVTLPEHKSALLIAGHVRRADPDTRSVLVEFPPEHALADTIRRVVFAVQQKRARTSN